MTKRSKTNAKKRASKKVEATTKRSKTRKSRGLQGHKANAKKRAALDVALIGPIRSDLHRMAQREHSNELLQFFGRLNMAYGGSDLVKADELVDAVRCYRSLVNELLVDGGQDVIDRVRALKLKVAQLEVLLKNEREK